MLQVKVTKMNDLKFKKDLFNPLKTGRKIDEFLVVSMESCLELTP